MFPVCGSGVERNLRETGREQIAVFPKKRAGYEGLEENLSRSEWGMVAPGSADVPSVRMPGNRRMKYFTPATWTSGKLKARALSAS